MARAGEIMFTEFEEYKLAREFVLESLPGAMGIKLEKDDENFALVNPANKVNYNVVLSPPDPTKITIPFVNKMPMHSKCLAKWIAVLEPDTSEVHLVMLDELRAAITMQKYPQGAIAASRTVTCDIIELNRSWAKQSNMIRKTVSLGKKFEDSFSFYRGEKKSSAEQFVHLHVHSMYSLLDCASTIEGNVQQAVMNGQPGLALTDHGVMMGLFKHYKTCKEYGIKPILGCEIYLVDDEKKKYTDANGKDRRFEYHQTVLAMNDAGWENLNELLSDAFRDDYYYVPRIGIKKLLDRSDGLIVLSGCFKGPVAWHLQEYDPQVTKDLPWYRTDPDRSREIMRAFKAKMGDRYYVELQSIDFPRYMAAMPKIRQMAADEGIPCAVTNDCHYEVGEDAALQAIMSKISQGAVGDGLGAESVVGKKGTYWIKPKSAVDMLGVLTDDMFSRTCEIMERCQGINIPLPGEKEFKYLFPQYKVEEDRDWKAFKEHQLKMAFGQAPAVGQEKV